MYDKPGSSLAEDTGTSSGRVEGHDSHFGSKRSEQPREASMTQPRSTSGTSPPIAHTLLKCKLELKPALRAPDPT